MVCNNETLYRQIARNISLRPMGRSKEVMPRSVLVTGGKWNIKNGEILTLSKAHAVMK